MRSRGWVRPASRASVRGGWVFLHFGPAFGPGAHGGSVTNSSSGTSPGKRITTMKSMTPMRSGSLRSGSDCSGVVQAITGLPPAPRPGRLSGGRTWRLVRSPRQRVRPHAGRTRPSGGTPRPPPSPPQARSGRSCKQRPCQPTTPRPQARAAVLVSSLPGLRLRDGQEAPVRGVRLAVVCQLSPVALHHRLAAAPKPEVRAGCPACRFGAAGLLGGAGCVGGQAEFGGPALEVRPEAVPGVQAGGGGGVGEDHGGGGGVAVQELAGEPGDVPGVLVAGG